MRFGWPGGPTVLDLADLSLPPGQSLFLHGPSGCGKSTLLALLAGVVVAQPGAVKLDGHDWARLGAAQRDALRADHVGVIFQQFNLLPYLSVVANVLLPSGFSKLRAARCQGEPKVAAQALLEQMQLPKNLWQRRAAELSVGQQQRVAAARALMGQPGLVIADEPTSALDGPLREHFMSTLLGACQAAGASLVFVSHEQSLAQRFDLHVNLPTINRAKPGLSQP